MRDKKISILLFVSFLLLLASFLILCTWVYHYYTKEKVFVKTPAKPALISAEVTRDSLLKIYTSSIQSLESQFGTTWLKSDSLETKLNIKLDEYYRLKNDLASLLKNPTSNDDFKMAKEKISELQKNMEELRNTSSNVEQENVRLQKILAQLNKDRRPEAQNVQYVESNNNSNVIPAGKEMPAGTYRKEMPEKNSIIPFSTSELSLTAVKDEDAIEQDLPGSQKKIIGSFALRNTITLDNSEVMVVVTQPNGQVLQKSAWESGSFQCQEGKKIYSVKMNFEYTRGEAKRFSFMLVTDKFTSGNYTMQIYNNGILIGRLVRPLS